MRRVRPSRPKAQYLPHACALVVAVVLALALPGAAGAARRIPRSNIPWGTLPASCQTAPTGEGCNGGWLHYLDVARTKMGLRPYAVPRSFLKLKPARQLFVLANLDRISYRLPVAAGLVRQLDSAAARAAVKLQDPVLPAGPFAPTWSANFAAAPNALEGYYLWMYDDGYPGTNFDCKRPGAPGCWGHRRDVLLSFGIPPGYEWAMGTAVARSPDGGSFTMLLAQAKRGARLVYSWASARRMGVGRVTYLPPSGS